MNKSKCKNKQCKKWHPQMGDIADIQTFNLSPCCKCNEKTLKCIIEHGVTPIKMIKGIARVTKEEMEMILYVMEDD